jgi:hypothetical protein
MKDALNGRSSVLRKEQSAINSSPLCYNEAELGQIVVRGGLPK